MKEKLLAAFGNLFDSAIAAAPKVMVGIGMIAIGLLLAKVIELALRFILTRIRFDSLMERAGIDKLLQRVGVRQQLNSFIPRLVYFLTLFLLAKAAADALGVAAISQAIGAFFNYFPNIIAALLLMVLGTSIGQFAGNTVAQAAKSSGIDFGPALGKVVSFLIMFVVTMMAIAQLQIDTTMVRIVTSFLMGAAALAFGLAFGLGTRDVVRNITAGFYLRKFLEIGRPVEIGGQHGVLTAITPTHSLLQDGENEISIANGVFLDQISKQ